MEWNGSQTKKYSELYLYRLYELQPNTSVGDPFSDNVVTSICSVSLSQSRITFFIFELFSHAMISKEETIEIGVCHFLIIFYLWKIHTPASINIMILLMFYFSLAPLSRVDKLARLKSSSLVSYDSTSCKISPIYQLWPLRYGSIGELKTACAGYYVIYEEDCPMACRQRRTCRNRRAVWPVSPTLDSNYSAWHNSLIPTRNSSRGQPEGCVYADYK